MLSTMNGHVCLLAEFSKSMVHKLAKKKFDQYFTNADFTLSSITNGDK